MVREKIIKELKANPNGFTVSELAKKMKISRNTIAITFAYLEGASKVYIRKTGMARVYYWGDEK